MRDAEQWGGVQSVCERRVGQGRRGREGLMGEVPVFCWFGFRAISVPKLPAGTDNEGIRV